MWCVSGPAADGVRRACRTTEQAFNVGVPMPNFTVQCRQFILSANCIRDLEPYFNGKMVVHVTPPFDGSIQVSRERVAALRVWLNS